MIERQIPRGLVERDILKHLVAVQLTRDCIEDELSVNGAENLQIFRELNASGKPCAVVSNHLSHSDAPTMDYTLRREGYSDLADKLVFILGIRLINDELNRERINSYSHITVWPPKEIPTNNDEVRESRAMNVRAARASIDIMGKGGILVLFPEGGRSDDGQLQLVDPKTIALFLLRLTGMQVLRWGMWGTEDVWPKGVQQFKKGKVSVNIGKPDSVDSLKDEFNGLSRAGMNEAITERIMVGLAILLPERYRGCYGRTQSSLIIPLNPS